MSPRDLAGSQGSRNSYDTRNEINSIVEETQSCVFAGKLMISVCGLVL